jgi:hypothetical protein
MNIDYERDCKIDYDDLDTEWVEQADLARRYAKHLSHLRSKVRKLEEEKKTIRSEIIDAINRNPEEFTGKTKPNSADIEAAYRRQKKYKEKMNEVLDAQEELDYAELAYQEIAWTKKKALEQLVTLHGQQYFAGPSMPRNLEKEMERKKKRQENFVQSVGKSTTKRRRRLADEE